AGRLPDARGRLPVDPAGRRRSAPLHLWLPRLSRELRAVIRPPRGTRHDVMRADRSFAGGVGDQIDDESRRMFAAFSVGARDAFVETGERGGSELDFVLGFDAACTRLAILLIELGELHVRIRSGDAASRLRCEVVIRGGDEIAEPIAL